MFVALVLVGMSLGKDACLCGGARQRPEPPPDSQSTAAPTSTAQPGASADAPP